jgi:hypothetical protein
MRKHLWNGWLVGTLLGWVVAPAIAQSRPPFRPPVQPRVIDQPGVTAPKPPADGKAPYEEPAAAKPLLKPSRPLTREEQDRVRSAQRTAADMVARSQSAFERGLMPLPDYLEQLSLADEIDLTAAELRQSEEDRLAVLRQQLVRYREAARDLEGFVRQAGPIGFGDQAFAQAFMARAEANVAFAENRGRAAWDALKQQSEWAARYAQVRWLDESLGLVPPETLLEAELLDGVASFPPGPRQAEAVARSLRQYRGDLVELQERVRRWSAQGAGIGRSDRVEGTRFELARVDMELAALQGDPRTRRAAFAEAVEASEALHGELTKYHVTGTATLFDIAAAWRQRDTLFREFAATDGPRNDQLLDAVAAGLARDYADVVRVAQQTRDLRGRHAGDVHYVRTLEAAGDLREIAAAIRPVEPVVAPPPR